MTINFRIFLSNPKVNRYDQVSLIPLHENRGLAILVDKAMPGNSLVIIYDTDGNAIFKDRLSKGGRAEKKYIFSELADGNYTVEVYSKNHTVQTQFSIYNNGDKRIVHVM